MSYSRVELWKEERKKCERERLKRSAEKESLKGSRTESLSERARKKKEKERHSAASKGKESYKVLEVEVGQERSQRVIPNLCLRGITSSSKRTLVLAAGFHLEGNLSHLSHFEKLHNLTQRVTSPVPLGDQESEIAKALFAGTSLVLVNAV